MGFSDLGKKLSKLGQDTKNGVQKVSDSVSISNRISQEKKSLERLFALIGEAVYKDDVASAVSEQREDLKASITEYLKIDNRNDLGRKGEILCTLAKKLEPHEKDLNNSKFKQLCSDTTFLLNNIGARHSLNPENKIKAQFLTMEDEAVEQWYDRTFQMFLACVAVIPYLEYENDIKALKNV